MSWMVRTVHGLGAEGQARGECPTRALLWLLSDQESGLRLPGSGLFLLRLPLVIGMCPPPTFCSLFQGEAREWSGEACSSEVRLSGTALTLTPTSSRLCPFPSGTMGMMTPLLGSLGGFQKLTHIQHVEQCPVHDGCNGSVLNNLISRSHHPSSFYFPSMLLRQRIFKKHLLVGQSHKPELSKNVADFCSSKEAL